MALIDEIRMDRKVFSVASTETPSDASAFCHRRSMEQRLETLELTRHVFNGSDPHTTRLQRILEVTKSP